MGILNTKMLVCTIVLVLVMAVPISTIAGDRPSGKPFEEIWEKLDDLQEQIDDLQAQMDDFQGQIDDLQDQIDDLQGQLDGLQAQLDAETTARIAGDAALEAQIDDMQGQLDGLQAQLDAETTARIAGDAALQAQIDYLQSQLDSYATNQLIHDFVVASGRSVTAGDVVSLVNRYAQKWEPGMTAFGPEHVFNYARTYQISAAALSSSKFVVAYRDDSNSYYGTAVIGEISGSTITYSPEYVFNPASARYISVAALSSDKIVIAYQDGGNYNHGTAIIGYVTGSTITYGPEYVFNLAYTNYISAAVLSWNKFVVAYRAGNYPSLATIGDVTGSTITFGSEHVFKSPLAIYISAAALSSSKFAVVYQDTTGFDLGKARIGDVTGSTITFGPEHVFNPARTYYISAAALSSSKFVVAYADAGNSYHATAIVGDVTGSTITFGSEQVVNPARTYYISAAALSSSRFVVAYEDRANSRYGTAVIGEVSGSTITCGSEYVFNYAYTVYISPTALSSSRFVVAYTDYGKYHRGTATIGDIVDMAVGTAKESGTAGQTVPVIINGVSDVHSGLTPGAIYYLDDLGNLTTDITIRKIGLAISSTEILLATPFF